MSDPQFLLDTNILSEPLRPVPNPRVIKIAAIAVVNELVVVTNNQADYADFQGIQVENWFIDS